MSKKSFHILTLFPVMIEAYLKEGIIGRAREKGTFDVTTHFLRDYAPGNHHAVDDRPYGGGSGMVLKPDVLVPALRDIKQKQGIQKTILLSPRGRIFNHAVAKELAEADSLLFICGRYEGVDERAIVLEVDEEISVGDYVVSGGELPALIMLDAISRFIPGVLGNDEGTVNESHADGLLEHPHYTRPSVYEGMEVPEVLSSGNHKVIGEWRKGESQRITKERRPDLWEAYFKNERRRGNS